MLENAAPTPAAAPADSAPVVKRYAPPNQRNRSLNRRKSEKSDHANNLFPNDVEKNQQHSSSRNIPIVDHGDVGSSNLLNENSHPGFIALKGCCHSEASRLLNDRWAAVMRNYNDSSKDLSERPVMYSGSSASAWGQFRLPHQFMAPANSSGPHSGLQMDFLSELRRAIHDANASSDV